GESLAETAKRRTFGTAYFSWMSSGRAEKPDTSRLGEIFIWVAPKTRHSDPAGNHEFTFILREIEKK
ncbi:MAG: hypothetical protein J6A23_08510, partial [Thermoguttaceae bacterium]|nr:hypothetical protein [Thermoguttaceae bacterium]